MSVSLTRPQPQSPVLVLTLLAVMATSCAPAAPMATATSTPAAPATIVAVSTTPAAPVQGSPVPAVPTPVGFGAARTPRKAAIVEPRAARGDFPRTVQDVNGRVTIPARPVRIHTLSVGYDEITLRLVDPARVVAIGSVSANPDFSNVADVAAGIPNKVGRNAEQIVALNPDLVVSSPFASPDLLKQLRDAGVPLVIADLVSATDAHEENIRFLAYLYGEEDAGEALIREVALQVTALNARTSRTPREAWPRAVVLSGGQTVNAAGSGTLEGGVLELAGARNAAAEAGISGNKDIALEALADIDPDYLVVAEANPDKPALLPRLRENPVVGRLRAMLANRVVVVKSSLITTLSYWNVKGAEQLAQAFRPGENR